MAAEKLTKQRLIQILAVLALLIVAFFWRTWTYSNQQIMDCMGVNQCTVSLQGNAFTITKISMGSYELDKVPATWSLNTEQGVIEKSDKGQWILNVDTDKLGSNPILKINDKTLISIKL